MTSLGEKLYKLTKKAYEKNELKELLMGYNGYAYTNPRIPVNIPTHVEFIFRDGIYPYYDFLDDLTKKDFLRKLENAIIGLMESDNPIECWWAFSICYTLKLNEKKYNKATFILSDKLLGIIKPYLLNSKEKLMNEKRYGGDSYPNNLGLWGDVLRINLILKNDFNFILLGD